MHLIDLPYGKETRAVAVPEENLAWVDGPKNAPPVSDLRGAIRTAIRQPIGSPSIKELSVMHGKKTLILIDDSTRATPQAMILPILLDEINEAGIPDDMISI